MSSVADSKLHGGPEPAAEAEYKSAGTLCRARAGWFGRTCMNAAANGEDTQMPMRIHRPAKRAIWMVVR